MTDHNTDQVRKSVDVPECIRISQGDQFSFLWVAVETGVHDVPFALMRLAYANKLVIFCCLPDGLNLVLVHVFQHIF
jgi:hypothetical protein